MFLLLGLLGTCPRGIDSWQSKAVRESAVTDWFQRPTFLLPGCSVTNWYFVFSKMPECVSYVCVMCNLKTRWGWPARSWVKLSKGREQRWRTRISEFTQSQEQSAWARRVQLGLRDKWTNRNRNADRFSWWQFGMGASVPVASGDISVFPGGPGHFLDFRVLLQGKPLPFSFV